MTMTMDELTELLHRLLAGWENEVVEFKEATRQFSADKTGEYVSALSNEANLRELASGWLVFGVSNSRQIVGTTHLVDGQQRQSLKHHIHQSIDQGLTIREVYEVTIDGKRVVLLEVPAAPRGIPISWKGDYRARAGESLVPLSLDKLDEVRRQTIGADWRASSCPRQRWAILIRPRSPVPAKASRNATRRASPPLTSPRGTTKRSFPRQG